MSDDLAKRLRETTYMYQADCELKMKCADRIEQLAETCEELEANINIKADFIDATINQLAASDQRIEELEAKLAKAVDALGELIDHTHNCEKELTEELHNADFCGESLPLTSARTTIAELSSVSCANLKGQNDE